VLKGNYLKARKKPAYLIAFFRFTFAFKVVEESPALFKSRAFYLSRR
jgi:hypothetical protein